MVDYNQALGTISKNNNFVLDNNNQRNL